MKRRREPIPHWCPAIATDFLTQAPVTVLSLSRFGPRALIVRYPTLGRPTSLGLRPWIIRQRFERSTAILVVWWSVWRRRR